MNKEASNINKWDLNLKERAVLHFLLDLGEKMVTYGAEIYRVEDTLRRMGKALGAVRMEVFVITSSMIVTMEDETGREWTQTRRIRKPASIDFTKIEAFNQLSRRCCREKMDLADLKEELIRIEEERTPIAVEYLGSIIGAGAFCMFFGGTLADGLTTALVALFICSMQIHVIDICPNRVVFNFVTALLSGMAICVICRLVPGLHLDKIMIGDIMLLIPGVAITNACRDVLAGDTMAGILRLTESVLWAAALAFGYLFSILLSGGIVR